MASSIPIYEKTRHHPGVILLGEKSWNFIEMPEKSWLFIAKQRVEKREGVPLLGAPFSEGYLLNLVELQPIEMLHTKCH